MKKNLLSALALLIAAGFGQPLRAQSLDPGFAAAAIYAPATVYSALEQADGKRLVTGSFTRAEGTAVGRLVRYTATGALDAAFMQNVGVASAVYRTGQLSNGKLLLTAFTNAPILAGGLLRNGLLRLNLDGTGDPSFDAGPGPASASGYSGVDFALPLANGQLLVGGYFDHFNGVATNNLVRLNADGSVDPAFSPTLGLDDEVEYIAPLPNGQYLIGSYVNGTPSSQFNGLARINANGSLDPTFNANLGPNDEANYLVVQPDGRILVAGNLSLAGATGSKGVVRLLPNGSLDNSFNATIFDNARVYSYYGPSLQLQPDGKVLVLNRNTTGPSAGVTRLNADGSVDGSFQVGPVAGVPFSFTRLASGEVLLAGSYATVGATKDRSLVQLSSSGAVTPGFSPLLQNAGSVLAVARQTDGKLVVGGYFSEVNGQSVRRVARFNPNGTLDTGYVTPNDLDGTVNELAVQPDGRLLLLTGTNVLRYLASGASDNSFTPPNLAGSNLSRLLLQPDGRVLVGGPSLVINGSSFFPSVTRLLADGTRDLSFVTNGITGGQFTFFQNMALQPDGKVLLAGNYRPNSSFPAVRTLLRLQSTGALDGSFTGNSFGITTINTGLSALTVQPDGKILVGGQFTSYAGAARANLARLNADGSLDGGFVPPALSGTVYKLLLQPNNRLLVGGQFPGIGVSGNLARLLPTGQADASFGPSAVPNGTVRALLVQPDGAIVLGGTFNAVGGVATGPLARITASNVLAVAAPSAVAARTEAWPVPAHSVLNVAPDASAHPQALDLLDALGRPVRHQELNSGARTSVSLQNLPPGSYLLRITYAEGAVVRRVQVQ